MNVTFSSCAILFSLPGTYFSCIMFYLYYTVFVLWLTVSGERLTDAEVDSIFKLTGTEEDLEGNIKYEGANL